MAEKEVKLDEEIILKVSDTGSPSDTVPNQSEITKSISSSGDNLIGMTVAEHYRVDALLGSGGMSTVYKAEHLLMKCNRAIKILKSADKSDSGSKDVRRFQQEATAICSLEHPHIVRVHEFGMERTLDKPYLVMDLIEGDSLSDLIKKAGPLSEDRALRLGIQIAEALKHAHSHSVIHRDIKPANVIITGKDDDESCKIVDFGIAKLTTAEETQSLTQTGEIFGSPLYMSPEQCLGHKVDHRSDLYSLGCLLYEAVAGSPPHEGKSSLETLHFHLVKQPPEAPVSKAVQAILDRLLSKDPDDRYQDAESLAVDLHKVLETPKDKRNQVSSHERKTKVMHETVGSLLSRPGVGRQVAFVFFVVNMVIVSAMIFFSVVQHEAKKGKRNIPENVQSGQTKLMNVVEYDNRFLFDGSVLPMHSQYGQGLKQAALRKINEANALKTDMRSHALREAHREYADLLLTDGESAKALEQYSLALSAWTQFGGDDEALKPAIGVGDAQMDLSNYPAAFDMYLKVLNDLDSRNIGQTMSRGQVLLKMATCKLMLGDKSSANQYLNESLDCLTGLLHSNDPAVRISAMALSGDGLILQQNFTKAARMFGDAVALAEDEMHNHKAIMAGDNVWVLRLKMAEAASLAGDTVMAERTLQRVLSDSTVDMPHHRELKARALYALALSYSVTSPKQALVKFEAAHQVAEELPDSALKAMIKDALASKIAATDPGRAKDLRAQAKEILAKSPPWSMRPLLLEGTVLKQQG